MNHRQDGRVSSRYQYSKALGLTSSRKRAVPEGLGNQTTAYQHSARCARFVLGYDMPPLRGCICRTAIPLAQPESGASPGTKQIPRSPRRPRDDKSRSRAHNAGLKPDSSPTRVHHAKACCFHPENIAVTAPLRPFKASLELRLQPLISVIQRFGQHPGFTHDGHEIGIGDPAR